jgi:hypothetical protein
MQRPTKAAAALQVTAASIGSISGFLIYQGLEKNACANACAESAKTRAFDR